MATETPISGLTALGSAPAPSDELVVVDVSDTTQASTGTTKRMTVANAFTNPSIANPIITGSATIAAGTVTGNLSVGGTTGLASVTASSVAVAGPSASGSGFTWNGAASLNGGSINFNWNGADKGYIGAASALVTSGLNTDFALRAENALVLSIGTTQAVKVASTGVTVAGSLVMSTAASKLVPGATSFSHRNNADSADNLLISDAGVVTVRASLTVTGGGITHGSTTLLTTTVALTAGGTGLTPTLTQGPVSGNPTKWVPINDNGTTRYIPTW